MADWDADGKWGTRVNLFLLALALILVAVAYWLIG